MRKTKNTIGKKIPLLNLSQEYKEIKKDIDTSVFRVLKGGWYILGSEGENFEKELAQFIGVRYAVGVASGTDALTLSLKALGVNPKDGVVIPANVYPTAFGVALSGARIQLADVESGTLNISLATLKKAVNKKTKVVVVVHLYGNPVDIAPVKSFCRQRGLYLIEDCAQAIGAEYKDKKVGTFGDVACFSFYPTKNLGAYGDAGAVLTNKARLAKRVKYLRMYGEKKRYNSVLIGHNSRLDELQAAILRAKLKYLDRWNKRRRKLAQLYKRELEGLALKPVEENVVGRSVYHLFVIRVSKRDALLEYLRGKGIGIGIHYPVPIHLVKSFLYLGYKKGDFPVSEKASLDVLSLPFYPQMTESEIKYVVSLIKSFYKK